MAVAEPVVLAPTAKSRGSLSRLDRTLGAVMLAPALIYIAALVGLPFLLAVFLSLTNSSAGSLDFSFVGLQNFANVVRNPVFQRSLKNTFIFTFVSQLTVIVCGNILARALMKRFPGRALARFIILMPWAAPVSLATLGWLWIFDSTFSVINWLLKVVGWLGPGQWYYWLGDTTLGMVAIITIHVWRMLPFSTVILLAGLGSIPARGAVDGAGPLAKRGRPSGAAGLAAPRRAAGDPRSRARRGPSLVPTHRRPMRPRTAGRRDEAGPLSPARGAAMAAGVVGRCASTSRASSVVMPTDPRSVRATGQ